jgi:hypothetical protein
MYTLLPEQATMLHDNLHHVFNITERKVIAPKLLFVRWVHTRLNKLEKNTLMINVEVCHNKLIMVYR